MPFVHSNKCHIYFHHKYRIWYMLYMNDAKQCSLWCIVEMTSFIYKWLVMLRGIVSISQFKLPSRLHSGRTPFWMLPTFVSNWLNCNSLCHFLDKNVTAKYILNILLYIIANFCLTEVYTKGIWPKFVINWYMVDGQLFSTLLSCWIQLCNLSATFSQRKKMYKRILFH